MFLIVKLKNDFNLILNKIQKRVPLGYTLRTLKFDRSVVS